MSSVPSLTIPQYFKLTPLEVPNEGEDLFFEKIEELGKGSFGTANLATTPRGRHRVVIKLNDGRAGTNSVAIKEAEMLAYLNKEPRMPHIPEFLGTFSTDTNGKKIAIITSLVPGKDTYKTYLGKQNSPPLMSGDILQMSVQFLEALEHLHKVKQCAHLDLKPENLFYNKETSTAHMIDFGSVKTIEEMTKAKEFIGTSSYRSPELILRKSYETRFDESVDLWALGVSLFNLYVKSAFIDISQGEKEDQNDYITRLKNDYLIQMALNLGMPRGGFIELLDDAELRFFSDDWTYLHRPPSKYAVSSVNELKKLREEAQKKYGSTVPLWKARIYMAAGTKGESQEDADKVIQLIEPMLNYWLRQLYLMTRNFEQRQRITASGCLQIARGFLPSDEPVVKIRLTEGKAD